MYLDEFRLSPVHRKVVERFLSACQDDERIGAAYLYGSYARGSADAHSDLDLGLVIFDEAWTEASRILSGWKVCWSTGWRN